MNARERYLYHQIHPVKLSADWGAGLFSLYPLWQHKLIPALLIMLIPPLFVSFIVMRFVDLEPYRQSAFGTYIAQHMTCTAEIIRLAGMVIMALGAWYHRFVIIAVGLAVVLAGWLKGKLLPGKTEIKS